MRYYFTVCGDCAPCPELQGLASKHVTRFLSRTGGHKMPMLTNSRHERFAQGLAQGKTADEAYRLAGYAANRGNASTLKANQNIEARVAELQARVVQGVILTREWVIERLIENV